MFITSAGARTREEDRCPRRGGVDHDPPPPHVLVQVVQAGTGLSVVGGWGGWVGGWVVRLAL